ncbi:MAG: DUF1194 domain-containing protein [Proteobacteria bacterium]|nr:DUF1194 domain-containing protein [Pseudomonadota bacterium]
MRAWRAGVTIWAVAALLAFAGPVIAQAPTPPTPGAAKTIPVDLELVLAVDVSRSIDADEFELQRQGYARAIVNPSVIGAIQSGAIGAIAVAYVEWSGADQQKTVVDWTLIRDPGSAQDFAAAILAAPRSFAAYTSISGAIDYSMRLFETNRYEGSRQVIDVSGDGSNNSGRPVWLARDAAIEVGITINGLAIINDRPNPFSRPEPKLDDYYKENVIGGSGAFVGIAEDFTSFASAILSKLIKEVAAAPDLPVRTRLAGAR